MRTVCAVALVCCLSGSAAPAAATDIIQLPPIEVRASYPLEPAAYRDTPVPPYPASARAQGLEGLVILSVQVDSRGRAGEVRVMTSSGARILDDSAVAAVKTWTFVPARRGPRAVESWVEVPMRFALTRK